MDRTGFPGRTVLRTGIVLLLLCTFAFGVRISFLMFDAPGGGTSPNQGTRPTDINEQGQIVGSVLDSSNHYHGFLRHQNGSFTSFDYPGAEDTQPAAVNGVGEVAGSYAINRNSHGFLRNRVGNLIAIDVPGAGQGMDEGTWATSINSQGTIAGYFITPEPHMQISFIRTANGAITTFSVPGQIQTAPGFNCALNDAGVFVGFYSSDFGVQRFGFERSADGVIRTFDVPESDATEPDCINSSGSVTGTWVDLMGRTRGFVRDHQGRYQTFDAPGARFGTAAKSISPNDTVAGDYVDSNQVTHGFARDRNGHFTTFDVVGSIGTGVANINSGDRITGAWVDEHLVFHGYMVIP
jgi:hypothetical protein